MKSLTYVRIASSSLVLSGLLAAASSGLGQTVSNPPAIYIFSPTNNSTFLAPASLTIYARAIARTGTVQTVEFFANSASLGVVTNGPGVQVTNGIPEPAFPFAWSNVSVGGYALTAVVTDSQGLTATSAVVNITVIQMPNLPLAVQFWYPTNGQTYTAPAGIGLHAQVVDSNIVQTVQYFNGTTSIGIVTNLHGVVLTNWNTDSPFYLFWSSVPAGTYTLTAVATDTAGIMATSPPVTVTVLPPPPPQPFVYIYSPTNGSMYLAPATLTLYAHAGESGGTVQSVQFFAGSTSLGVVPSSSQVVVTNLGTEPLFPLTWSNVVAGTYALKAVATDAAGMTATSAVVSISVVTSWPVVRPSVYIYSPANGSKFVAPTNLTLYARASEGTTGVVQTVQFFAGDTSLGIVANSSQVVVSNISSGPLFPLAWPNVAPGSYALKAIATDAAGITATSAVVNITVVSNVPPVPVPYAVGFWYPTNGQSFTAPANVAVHAWVTDSNIVQTMQYFAGGTSLGIVTNPAGVLLTNSTSANPFALVWSNVLAGSYTLTAVATDAAGLVATSPPVNITVSLPLPARPTVYIYSPANGAKYVTPTNLTLYARAVETGGTVQTVQFFAGDTSLGIVPNSSQVVVTNLSSEPLFPLTWPNVPAGSYALTAVATDALGTMATSSVVNITVTAYVPPPNLPLALQFWYPTNGQTFTAPASIGLHAQVVDSNIVQTVQYFAGATSIGIVTNLHGTVLTNWTTDSPFYMLWSNVLAGSYTLTAVATDTAGIMATSPPVTIAVLAPPPAHPSVYIYSPANGSRYVAPANLTLYARAIEGSTGVVQTVQFFAGDTSLGIVPNSSQVVVSNLSSEPLFSLAWSNVLAGAYALKAVATDAAGMTATSAVVTITVTSNVPPPNLTYAVSFWYPTNGQSFTAPANVGLHAWVTDSNVVQTMQYFAGATSIGIVSNTAGVLLTNTTSANPFFLLWSNVPAASYSLTAVATDFADLMATSPPVVINVLPPPSHTNRPPSVRISSPPDAAIFHTPVNIPIYAYAYDSDGFVTSVEFMAGTNSLGFGGPVVRGTNEPPAYYTNVFFLVWSNAPVGAFPLTVIATDNSNAVTVSPPVNITIVPPSPPATVRVPTVYLTAIDPLAIEGTNCWVWSGQTNTSPTWTNWPSGTVPVTNCGPKNATFSVYRSGDTTNALTVAYSIGGTATNGFDYVVLPGTVTIPAGQRQAMISIVPLDDGPPEINSTVILNLLPDPTKTAAYAIGSQASAAVLIVDSTAPQPATSALADRSFHLQAVGPNGAWFSVQSSTDMVYWTPIVTNQVVNGSIDFIDPKAATSPARFYRAVPQAKAP